MSFSKQRYIVKRKLENLELLAKKSGYWSKSNEYIDPYYINYIGTINRQGELSCIIEITDSYLSISIISSQTELPPKHFNYLHKLISLLMVENNFTKKDILEKTINYTSPLLVNKEGMDRIYSNPEKLEIKINIIYKE